MNYENQAFIDRVEQELDPIDTYKIYDDMLDECFSFKSIGGIFANMLPSTVLGKCDPIAYRCGYSDYIDSLDNVVEINGDYYEQVDIDIIYEEEAEGE